MSATYTYIGHNFVSPTGLYTTADHVTAYIEFASALPPNLGTPAGASNSIPKVVSFSFTDGVNTISSANGGMIDIGPFTTDGSGNILFGNSDASIRIGSGPGSKAEVISILGGIGDAASDANLATLVASSGSSRPPGTWLSAASGANLGVLDTTTGQHVAAVGTAYVGPVAGLQDQYVNLTADSLNLTATSPNWFIHSGSGQDAINVSQAGGNNILDGGTGSNFLTGGAGNDTFYLDSRNAAAPIFSTVAGFHSGDNVTVWGVNASNFTVIKLDNQGAVGFTGLDFVFTAPGRLNTSFVLAGYTSADLTNGRLSSSYGITPDLPGLPGSQYFTIHAT